MTEATASEDAAPPARSAEKIQTKNVFVDTGIHVSAKFVYSGGGFRRLADLAAGDLANVYHTEIDQAEIESNIGEQAEAATNALKKFQREAMSLRTIPVPEVSALFHSLDADQIRALLSQQFHGFRARARSMQVPLDLADTSEIFQRYFNRKAPFEEKKKTEFPDAFAVAALSGWCWANSELMYVISGDKGFRAAAKNIGRGRLIPLESLDEFLDLVVSRQHQELAIVAQQWLRANDTVVAQKVTDAFLNAGFYVEDADGDAEDIDVDNLLGSAPLLVEVDDGQAVFTLTGEITFTAVLVYDDPHSGIYDKEDDVMLFTETKRRRVRRTTELDAEIKIRFQRFLEDDVSDWKAEGEIEDVTVNRGRDFPISIEDELVEVFPDEDANEPDDWYIEFLNSRDEDTAPEGEADDRPGF